MCHRHRRGKRPDPPDGCGTRPALAATARWPRGYLRRYRCALDSPAAERCGQAAGAARGDVEARKTRMAAPRSASAVWPDDVERGLHVYFPAFFSFPLACLLLRATQSNRRRNRPAVLKAMLYQTYGEN